MSRYNKPNKPVLQVLFIIFALVNLQLSAAFAVPADDSNPNLLKKAETHYHRGEFNETQTLIRRFLKNDSVSKPERVKAYTLLSKTFIAQNKTASAKEIIRKIFAVNPAYHPTLEQEKPSYIKLVDAVRTELKPKKAVAQTSHSNTLLWAGAGSAAALAILIGVLISGDNGDGSSHTLPKPPEFPNK